MSTISRRGVLGGAALVGAGAAVAACAPTPVPTDPIPLPEGPFPWGVMSGDPKPNSAVIWTRLRSEDRSGNSVVEWQISADESFSEIAVAGSQSTNTSCDHTVKVAVGGLDPDRRWYYRFLSDGAVSSTGIARTAPSLYADVSRLRIAYVSCQMYSEGYFAAYRHILAEDVDFVVHLGDYIYEYGTASKLYGLKRLRQDPVDQPTTVEGYRSKYRLYRSDPDLVECHRQLPFVPTWDDHEVYDDYDRTSDPARRAAAYQAWFENMPYFAPEGEPSRVDRSLRWGNLVDVYMLDLAQHRDPVAPAPFASMTKEGRIAHSTDRTLLGNAQRDSLKEWLIGSDAAWRLLGNPQMLQQLRLMDFDSPELRRLDPKLPRNAGLYLNGIQWDGYQWERQQILDHMAAVAPKDNVVITGDIHSWWAGPVRTDIDDPKAPMVATEFVGGSVTSPGFDSFTAVKMPLANDAIMSAVGSLKYVNLFDHGYGICEITPDAARVDFRRVDIDDPGAGVETLASFRVNRGTHVIDRVR